MRSLREPANSHRYLAVRRGQAEDELQVSVGGPPDDPEFEARLVLAFEAAACSVPDSPGAEVLRHAGRIAFKNNVRTSIENEVHRVLKDAADAAAAQVFAENVKRRLLEAPLGARPVLGVDPGIRTGCKLAAVDASGRFVATDVAHLQTDEQKAAARETLARLAREHAPAVVAIGNGTGGREAEVFVRAALREAGLEAPVVLVSEAGASVYSASDAARAEFPDLDATVRGAISIARRLQDPLAELVKIEPRSIGVGQYQHDVSHAVLQRALDAVVEDCVNGVGVNLNTASRHLLAHVAGLGPSLAAAIVEHREKQGLFRSRQQLLDVPRLGPKAFEQAAGFLRVPGGDHPLDATGVHPERYARPRGPRGPAGQGCRGPPRPRGGARAGGEGPRGGAGSLHLGRRPGRAREARARPPRDLHAVLLPRRRPQDGGPEAGDGLPRDREQRDELRRLRGHRGPSRRPRPRLAARGEARQGAGGGPEAG